MGKANIETLERETDGFYAPAFRVRVGGKDLVADKQMEVLSVQVDNALGAMDRFTVVIDGAFDLEKREFSALFDFFAFGASVEIDMGYVGPQGLVRAFAGLITSVRTSFPSSGLPQITVSGYDYSYRLMTGKTSNSWENKQDSDVVRLIAASHNLSADVQNTKVTQPTIEQSQESDFEFVTRLAERNGFEWCVFGERLHFAEPVSSRKSADLTLEWGKGLMSFSPEVNIADQVSEVEVRGWDPATKQEIVGRAKAGDEIARDRGRQSGAEILRRVRKKPVVLHIRRPVFSQQEADRVAQAILSQHAEGLVRGTGDTLGIPTLRADTNIELLGLGKQFSRTYYVKQCTHSIGSGGYKTSFTVKDTTI